MTMNLQISILNKTLRTVKSNLLYWFYCILKHWRIANALWTKPTVLVFVSAVADGVCTSHQFALSTFNKNFNFRNNETKLLISLNAAIRGRIINWKTRYTSWTNSCLFIKRSLKTLIWMGKITYTLQHSKVFARLQGKFWKFLQELRKKTGYLL